MSEIQPVYMQLAEVLQGKIESNEYKYGMRIPSERELSQIYGISRMTVRKSVDLLIDRGLLVRMQGKGTFVSKSKITSSIDSLKSMGRFIQESGFISSNKVIYSGKEPAGAKYARIFCIEQIADVFTIIIQRFGDGEPLALEYVHFPYNLISDAESYDYKTCTLDQIFEKNKIPFTTSRQVLEIVRVCNPQAALLNLAEDTPVFKLRNTITDDTGLTIGYTCSYIGGNKFTFSGTLT